MAGYADPLTGIRRGGWRVRGVQTKGFIEVNCPGDSLQAAIDAADPGDTIRVTGTCVENLTIDKDLTVDGQRTTVLDGGGIGSVVTVDVGDRTHHFLCD